MKARVRSTVGVLAPLVLSLAIHLVTPISAPAQSFLDRLEQRLQQIVPTTPGDEETLPPDVGRPGYLGLVGDEVPNGGGVRVETLKSKGPAERAGLRVGDRIIGINGAPVRNLDDMARGLERQWVRSRLEFQIDRDGEERQVSVVLGERPVPQGPSLGSPADPRSDSPLPPSPPRPSPDLFLPPPANPLFGATLGEVTTTLQRRYGLTASSGAIVLDIEAGTPADNSRLLRGALITEINGRPIRHPDDVRNLLENSAVGDSWKLTYLVRQQSYQATLVLAAAPVVVDDLDELPPAEVHDGDPVPLPLPAPPVSPESPESVTRSPADTALDLAQRLGRDGRRPLLGRIGQVLDEVTGGARTQQLPPTTERPLTTPPSAPPGASGEPLDVGEFLRLQAEVRQLRAEVEQLRRRLEGLEQRIVPRDP
jgi:hypothetical protein